MVDYDIVEFSLKFSFTAPNDILTDIISHMSQSNFQLNKINSAELRFKQMQELFPRMSLTDETGHIHIDLNTNNLEMEINKSYTQLLSDSKPSTNIFAKENLVQYNADINYIVGTLMSILHLEKLKAEVYVGVIFHNTKFNFEHLLSKNILLNNEIKLALNGIQLESVEEFFGASSKTMYRFWNVQDKSKGSISFKQDMVLPIQIDKMVYTLSDHINNILKLVRE